MRGDMHMHSTYSDGSFTVVELMEMIKACKLDIVALTDHDTIDGVEEMIALGKKNNVIVIPGLELSTKENDILEIKGRHDPSIVRRSSIIIKSMTALTIADLLMEHNAKKTLN